MIELILTLIIVGVALWLVENYIPLSPPIKIVIQVIVVLACVIYLLQVAGIYNGGLKLR